MPAAELIRKLKSIARKVDVIRPRPLMTRRSDSVRLAEDLSQASIAIAVPDHTRPLRAETALNMLMPALGAAGARPERVLVIFATGTHRMSKEDAARLLGRWADRVRFKIHDCKEEHVYVGRTPLGTDVEVDKDFMSADLRIIVGAVAPHPWAGFSGGSKMVLPGISSLRTIVSHHLRWFEHPSAKPGVLAGNKFREDIEHAGALAGVDYALNVILDDEGNPAYSSWGTPAESFARCASMAEQIYIHDVHEEYDLLVVDASPADIDLYQATKAVEQSAAALAEGGTMILLAECQRGIGPPCLEAFLKEDPDELRARVSRGEVQPEELVPALIAICFAKMLARMRVILVSERLAGLSIGRLECYASLSEALAAAGAGFERVLVIERGGALALRRAEAGRS